MTTNHDLTDEQAFFGIALVMIASREKTIGPAPLFPTPEVPGGPARKIRDEVIFEARLIARAFVEGIEEIGKQPAK